MSGFDAQGVNRQALDWALRMSDPDADWEAFTMWLEADPSQSAAYDRAVLALEEATRTVAERAPLARTAANDPEPAEFGTTPVRRDRRLWLGGAVAAALVGAIGIGAWQQRDHSYSVATRPGEQRTVDLADGSHVVLAGGSRVRLDQRDPRSATVEAGQMLFTVRHDASDPFRVRVRDLTLTDLGTIFDVQMIGRRTRVAVAEGAVMVDPQGAAVRLDPGQAVVSDGDTLRREASDVNDIGVWRDGLLVFSDATLADVAESLSRSLGLPVTAAPAVGSRPFNGTLEVARLRRDPSQLGPLLGVAARRSEDGWLLDVPR